MDDDTRAPGEASVRASGRRRCASRGAIGNYSQLAHEGHVVPNAPLLGSLAIAEAEEVDVLVGHLATRWRNAHEVAGVATVVSGVDDHSVVLGDHLVDLPALIAEDRGQPVHRPGHAFEALWLIGTAAQAWLSAALARELMDSASDAAWSRPPRKE